MEIVNFNNSKERDGFWEAYRGCAEENRVRPDRSRFYVNWAKDFANFLPEKPLKERSRKDVEAVDVSMREIIDALEHMFIEKAEGRVEMPPKPGIHTTPDAFIHAMPAYIPALNSAGIKWVSGYPENWKRGLPYIMGLLILNDPDTGMPIKALVNVTFVEYLDSSI